MQNWRNSFRRSRTPTPKDMKTQSSLEVPKQIRSASFDENQLGNARGTNAAALLAVPQIGAGTRSRSFDSAGSDETTHLEVPRFWRRRLGKNSPIPCVHCKHMKTWLARKSRDYSTTDRVFMSSSADDDDDESDSASSLFESMSPPQSPPPPPFFISSPPPLPSIPSFEFELQLPSVQLQPPDDSTMPPQRRRSISRQEALFVEPTGNSLENVRAVEEMSKDSFVHDIYLAVPDLKRDRAASFDSSFSKVSGARAEEVNEAGIFLTVPGTSLRSHSVDIVLPTADHARYKALALNSTQLPPTSPKSPEGQPKFPITLDTRRCGEGGARVLRSTPDWGDGAISGEHLWSPTSASGDCCYVGDAECQKHGTRLKCSACKIIAHQACIDILIDRVQFTCKPTFRDVGVRQYREQTAIHHHWVHRRTEKGKCKACGKTLQAKLSFSSKEIVALSCAWCKDAYHNKDSCFNLSRIGEDCSLGLQSNIIVPPSWIVKLPRRGSFKSSLRKSPKKKNASKKKGKDSKNEQKTFAIKPIPTAEVSPVIVFINPKSGGNQGAKLLQKFQWLLNPRQVFDLTQGGPGPGLELFRKVNNLRILACGGDGTVGWVLSVLDRIGIRPAVGVLPLGTGNDLARALGWGGGYEDEPISKILANIGESDTVLLDRWQLTVEPNAAVTGEDTTNSKPDLPLNVVNNYFSFGVDAHIALEFHEAREAHPEKFNSRIRNKLFYGTAGGKDLMQRKWKGLAELVTMECDGKDLTPVLKEHRVHAIVFLNIPSYGGGTHPWNKSGGTVEPSTEDGLIEVVGLTTYQLPLLQAGAHGTCICQCKTAKIVTSKVIPMQVDGEACRLNPSIITISRLNQAIMLAKKKPGRANALAVRKVIEALNKIYHKYVPWPTRREEGNELKSDQTTMEKLTLSVNLITMDSYEKHHYDKELLANTADRVGTLEVNPAADLEQLRLLIKNLLQESPAHSSIADWWFVDSVTAERFFRIDKAQENIHFPADIAHEDIYILDATLKTPDTETTSVHPETTATGSLDRTGPSISLETTTGWSVSLDTSQSLDMPSAGISIDVTESHASESGPGSPVRIEDIQATSTASVSPKTSLKISSPAKPPLPPQMSPLSPLKSPLSAKVLLAPQEDSPPLCLSPPSRDHLPSRDSIAKFKTIYEKLFGLDQDDFGYRNLLEKTSDGLLKAAKTGDLGLMKDLHVAGYSLLSIDSSGRTALHIAARYGQYDIVKYLVEAAPSSILNMQENETGQTALHKATANAHRGICCLLVVSGASLTKPDHAGYTPRQLALRKGDHELAAYLQSQEHFQLVSEDLETAV